MILFVLCVIISNIAGKAKKKTWPSARSREKSKAFVFPKRVIIDIIPYSTGKKPKGRKNKNDSPEGKVDLDLQMCSCDSTAFINS